MTTSINTLTNEWGWGPDGINPDRCIDPPLRRGLAQAIAFVLDGPDDEHWHDLRAVAERYADIVRTGRGFIPVPSEDREALVEICLEYADYEANQHPDDDPANERERRALALGAEYLAEVIAGTLSALPLTMDPAWARGV